MSPVYRLIPFEDWWNQVVLRLEDGIEYTRASIVKTAANKDGGAHVDAEVPTSYENLKNADWIENIKLGEEVFQIQLPSDLHFVALRQFAYEVLNSPSILELAKKAPGSPLDGFGQLNPFPHDPPLYKFGKVFVLPNTVDKIIDVIEYTQGGIPSYPIDSKVFFSNFLPTFVPHVVGNIVETLNAIGYLHQFENKSIWVELDIDVSEKLRGMCEGGRKSSMTRLWFSTNVVLTNCCRENPWTSSMMGRELYLRNLYGEISLKFESLKKSEPIPSIKFNGKLVPPLT